MDFKKIEAKWQKRWEREKIFEANVSKKNKFFITFPYPYLNGSAHIGHSYSFFRCEAYARFKRMQGFNVLFPQGFHASGEAFLGSIERLKSGDELQISTFKSFGASDKDLEKFKNDPIYAAKFWMKKFIEDFKKSGASIDWRRSFVTAITPTYNRFIEWQYNTLRKKGYVVQGTHPVIWCPKCKSPTGDHDRLEGEGESPVEYVILKFYFKLGKEKLILPAATLRPETIYGVTNMWINPNVEYVIAKVEYDNECEKWIVSKECAEKLKDQLYKVKILGTIKGSEILGKKCTDPISNKEIPILPASFVKTENATGIVMSVPSHAPYDWIGIKELIDKNELEKYGISSKDLEPISIIQTPEFSENPAVDICEKMGIKSSKDIEKLEKATSIVYKKEFHLGKLKENCGEYSGLNVSDCKEKLAEDFKRIGIATSMWDCNKVVCKCTTQCHVKILEDQWFLKYSDEQWKNLAKKCLSKMKIYPENARSNFLNTIDWLNDKACARKTGLGTQLPWDKDWIIETLSDSTIYMAYYTISRIINEKKISAKKLTDEVFDYVFLGKGQLKDISKKSGLPEKIIESMRKEFEYFYPLDFRGSGKDLIQNHLTFFIFHHVAIFPEKYWPKAIGVNGWINVEGEKMSKSKGNIIPLRQLINDYGADLTRINIIGSSEGLVDADWRAENIKSYRTRIQLLFDLAKKMKNMKTKKSKNVDMYLISRLQEIIEKTTENYEKTKFRSGLYYAFFEALNELKWYIERVGGIKNANKKTIKYFLENVAKLLAPIIPHFCEELWHMLGNKNFVSVEKWPEPNKKLIDKQAEASENLIRKIISDVDHIKKIVKTEPKKIKLFIAESWKFEVYKKVMENRNKNINDITREIMSEGKYGKATVAYIQSLYKKMKTLEEPVSRKKQFEILNEAKLFLEKQIGCPVKIEDAEKSDEQKARQSTPEKPGILLE